MSQRDILDILKKENDWLGSSEIHKKLKNKSYSSIRNNLKRLSKHKEIRRRESNKLKFGFEYTL